MILNFIKERANYAFALVLAGYFISIIILTNFLQAPPWGDEFHYIDTVRFFMNAPFSIETFKTYSEMHPPLGYMMYALVGKIIGDHIFVFRIVTMIAAAVTFLVIFILYKSFLNELAALIGVLFFMFNPYVFGLSVFVFTDIPSLMFLLLAVLAFRDKKPLLYLLFCTCAMLCRQYNAFLIAAVCAWSFYNLIFLKDRSQMIYVVLSAVSMLPFGLLTILWEGLAPPLANEHYNATREEGFHPDYLITYITILTIYIFPLVLFNVKKLFLIKNKWIFSLVGLLYFVFPIRASIIAIRLIDVHTIGFFHKLLKRITGNNVIIEDVFYYVFFSLGLIFFYWLVKNSKELIFKSNDRTKMIFVFLNASFLLIMTFSFFVWEKYIVPGLPFLIGWVMMIMGSMKTQVMVTSKEYIKSMKLN